MEKAPMTEYGYQKITNELKHLKEVERPQIIVEIDTARAHGDLKENAEYHAAKEKQVFIETRINELSDIVSRAHVIDASTLPHERVSFGSTVKLLDLESEDEVVYHIVGGVESNPDKNMISYHSPLAKQLIGKQEGDEVHTRLPGGEKDFEVLEVGYEPLDFGAPK